jgi:hypothetical protein
MARVNVEIFFGDQSQYWATPHEAEAMAESGMATWINNTRGRRCLRLVGPPRASSRRNAPSLTTRDMQVSAGIVESAAEERAVRRRVEAWAPRRIQT